MKNIFFYGTLRHLPLLELVLGKAVPVQNAVLAAHVAVFAKGQDFPILIARPDAIADGILVALDDADIARVDFYEGLGGYELKPVSVTVGDTPVEAWVYWPDMTHWEVGADWDLAAWQRDWSAIIRRGVAEIMAAYGHQSLEDVDARHGMIMARAQAYENTAAWRRPRSLGKPMGREAVELASQNYDHLGFFTLEHLTMRHERFAGGPKMEVKRAVFRAGEAVTLLPYDPVRDRVLLLEQFRAAPYAQGDPEPWLLEPIAGIVDAGETVEASARREAVEEAGLSVGDLHFVARYYPSPGATAQVLHSYVAIVDLPDDTATGGGLANEGEDIAVYLCPLSQAMDMVASGEIAVAPLIMSLQWLDARKDQFRA